MKGIEFYRKRISITQTELANRLGVTQGAISQWESGATNPDINYLLIMSEIFGCTVDEIIKRNEKK